MIVNKYDGVGAFKFLENLNKRLDSTRRKSNPDSAVIITNEELENILSIVQNHANFCLHAYTYDDNKQGFAVYNMNKVFAISEGRPDLDILEKFLPNPNSMFLRRLHNATMDKNNLTKTTIAGLNTSHSYYTRGDPQNGMPKYISGMKLMNGF